MRTKQSDRVARFILDLFKSGTSEGAVRAWETRREGAPSSKDPLITDADLRSPSIGIGRIQHLGSMTSYAFSQIAFSKKGGAEIRDVKVARTTMTDDPRGGHQYEIWFHSDALRSGRGPDPKQNDYLAVEAMDNFAMKIIQPVVTRDWKVESLGGTDGNFGFRISRKAKMK